MKIISKYVLKEHVGPFTFALTALTSLMLLQYIARRFGDLVGKGLPWQVIGEFFVLSIPFTVAMTLPMAVLVAVLYAFSRLASENEITALKAGGVSMRQLVVPVLFGAFGLSLVMVAFNDQLLPRTNHRLAVLQMDIFRTKPTFALREQVINTVKEGQLYLRAGRLDEGSSRMRDVVIYDLADPVRRRTIYADSGSIELAPNKRDLQMFLHHGVMMTVPTDKPGQLTRLYYENQLLRVPGVASQFQATGDADTVSKGDREMSVCEMQEALSKADTSLQRARWDSVEATWLRDSISYAELQFLQADSAKRRDSVARAARGLAPSAATGESAHAAAHTDTGAARPKPPLALSVPKELGTDSNKHVGQTAAAMPPVVHAAPRVAPILPSPAQPSASLSARPSVTPPRPRPVPPALHGSFGLGGAYCATLAGAGRVISGKPAVAAPAQAERPVSAAIPRRPPSAGGGTEGMPPDQRLNFARINADQAQLLKNRYDVEIQKKFSLAAACVIFVLVGAPIAVRFPRGGVGLVIGVSFFIFAVYYVGLIGGEELANRGIISAFWAMWGTNVIMTIVGLVLTLRMGREATTGRGGDFTELLETVRMWFARFGRRFGIPLERRRRIV